MMRRLLILTQYFPPEMGAPQARLSELGSRLAALDWDVQVLTALPNYPTGRVFEGYEGKRFVRETVGGLDTVRTWLTPSQSARTLERMRCYLTFAWSSLRLGPKLCERPDLVWVESPPLFLCATARRLARGWRVPFVINVSDLWPESFVHMGRLTRSSPAYRAMRRLEHSSYRAAAGVTGQSEGIVAAVREAVPGVRAELITNGVEPDRFGRELADAEWRREAGWEGKRVFVFAGLHGLAQGLDQVLAAAARLRDREDILFALVGEGPVKAELQTAAERAGLSNVAFYPAVARDRVPALLASADAALVTLGSAIRGAVPSKIYEAMASGLPILLVAEGEPADRVERAGAGIAVRCGDVERLAAAAVRLADDAALRDELGAAGRRAAEEVYSRDAVAARLSRFLESVLPK
jgi:glycosyltransferase involved in cell wall biosynthesis